jgi:hypothetical protein
MCKRLIIVLALVVMSAGLLSVPMTSRAQGVLSVDVSNLSASSDLITQIDSVSYTFSWTYPNSMLADGAYTSLQVWFQWKVNGIWQAGQYAAVNWRSYPPPYQASVNVTWSGNPVSWMGVPPAGATHVKYMYYAYGAAYLISDDFLWDSDIEGDFERSL